MKILFLGEFDPAEIVPAPIKVGKELFISFKNSGHNIFYLPYFQDGNKYSRFKKLFGFENITENVYRTGIFPLLTFVIKFKPEIIHIFTPGLYYTVLFPLKIFFRFKLVTNLHSLNRYVIPNHTDIKGYKKHRFLLIEKILVKFSSCVLVYTKRDKKYISMYYKVMADKIRVVNNGINKINVRKENFSFNSPLKIAFVGQIKREEKAFNFLIKALSKLNLPTKLDVYSHYKQSENGISKVVNVDLQIHDPLPEIELRKEFIDNDIFILPSIYESFSISLLEAMSTGILFLASNRVGLTERFQNDLKDLTFQKNNIIQFSERINYLLKLSNEQKSNKSLCIIDFTKDYYWDKISADYLTIYSQVL